HHSDSKIDPERRRWRRLLPFPTREIDQLLRPHERHPLATRKRYRHVAYPLPQRERHEHLLPHGNLAVGARAQPEHDPGVEERRGRRRRARVVTVRRAAAHPFRLRPYLTSHHPIERVPHPRRTVGP